MVYEPTEQLAGVISDFRNGVISLSEVDARRTVVYPLVIVPETLPQFPALWQELSAEMERRGILTTADREKLQVWDLHELESILFLMEGATVPNLVDFIEGKVRDIRSKYMPLRNYLIARDFPFGAPILLREARQRLARSLAGLMEARRGARTA